MDLPMPKISRGEAGRQVVRIESPAFEQAFERPEGELTVVRGQAHPMTRGPPVRQVVADLAVARLALQDRETLTGVAQRIADRKAQQHAADPARRKRTTHRFTRTLQQGGSGRQESFGNDTGGKGQVRSHDLWTPKGQPRGRPAATDPAVHHCRRVAG